METHLPDYAAKKAAQPCYRCGCNMIYRLKWGDLSEPLKDDIQARYCAHCFAADPIDAEKAKRKLARQQKRNYKEAR